MADVELAKIDRTRVKAMITAKNLAFSTAMLFLQ